MITNRAAVLLVASLAAACGGTERDASPPLASDAALTALRPGAVFTMTDDAAGNAVLSFTRAADGTLVPAGSTATGGAGSGGGEGVLGSQGALALSDDGRFLLAVNAGSDEISSFRVDGSALALASRAPSGGALPVSVAVRQGLVYVVDAGDASSAAGISGFLLGPDGALTPLPGSSRPLGADHPGPAQIAFDASGTLLAVTEKASQAITLYRIGDDGLPSAPWSVPSSGRTPFGFAFTLRDVLVVSEAQGGQAGASTASSYVVDGGTLVPASAAIPDHQTAACWLVATRDGRHAFVANAGSQDVSSYGVDVDGRLALLAGEAGSLAGGTPLDLALAGGDRYLYALDAANHAIGAFAVDASGSLTALPEQAAGLPVHAVGLAAR